MTSMWILVVCFSLYECRRRGEGGEQAKVIQRGVLMFSGGLILLLVRATFRLSGSYGSPKRLMSVGGHRSKAVQPLRDVTSNRNGRPVKSLVDLRILTLSIKLLHPLNHFEIHQSW
ncbi:hypothetical protein H4Q26_009810 [Puccinia striiformis f. sp. tritici PST-130]|nr:hypothetical protein H4Q26_009810 [Puccinia striiformis f. sp. tritici PST-130]